MVVDMEITYDHQKKLNVNVNEMKTEEKNQMKNSGGIKNSDNNYNNTTISEKLSSLILWFLLFSTIFLLLFTDFFSSTWDLKFVDHGTTSPEALSSVSDTTVGRRRQCNLFTGNWVPEEEDGHYLPYYTNSTNCIIDDRQNCLKFGRPDTEFLKWKWKPDGCDLPRFDGAQFLELVRGKSMAFVGDSLSRNQIESLVCMLASVAVPLNVSNILDKRMTKWEFTEQNFTLVAFWSVHLVRSEDAGSKSAPLTMNVYLDEVDEFWANHIENFDYVIISAGQWFLRPLMYYEKRKLVGCYLCKENNVTDLTKDYGIKMAFRTSFKTLINLAGFNGVTFLRTFTPQHYENGEWNGGGNCLRKRPFMSKEEAEIGEYFSNLYLTQMQEIREAEIEGRKEKGLKFRVLDVTEMMSMRPDGHPNHYRRSPDPNNTIADCVHWCLPGPVDTLNELLLHMMKMEDSFT